MPAPKASSPKPCPICGKPAAEKYRPFCGQRCVDVDLNRWLSGSYVVPGEADADVQEQIPKLPNEEND